MAERPSPAERIALAWRELRRGASGVQLRRHLLGQTSPPLEQAQVDALEVLDAAPDGLRMSEFADALRVDPSTATRSVDRLERLGLATRRQAGDDRRFVRAQATPEGTRAIRRIMRRRAIGMERLLEPFDGREREEFASYLERFVASINAVVDDLGHGNQPG